MSETFKQVPGYDNVHASDQGRLKYVFPDGTEKPIRLDRGNVGNLVVTVPVNGRVKQAQAHHLIALAWVKRPPQAKQVRFKDGDKGNILPSNLYWHLPLAATVKKHLVVKGFDPFEDRKGMY